VLPREGAIHLLNLAHEVRIETANFDSRGTQAQFTSATNLLIGIENADHYSLDSPFDDAFHAGNLRRLPRRAWLQCGEYGSSCESSIL